MLAVNIACAETGHRATRLRASSKTADQRMGTQLPYHRIDQTLPHQRLCKAFNRLIWLYDVCY